MENELLSYNELIDLFPFISKLGVKKLNARLIEKLNQKGLIEKCEKHAPIFVQFAVIKDPEFQMRQFGYKCSTCHTRLHPTEFVEFDFNKHCSDYQAMLDIKKPKTALEIAKDLVK